jgi:hypothetical protein
VHTCPPVLVFQLKVSWSRLFLPAHVCLAQRFEHSSNVLSGKAKSSKITTFVQFPAVHSPTVFSQLPLCQDKLDMGPFCHAPEGGSSPRLYSLFAVIVHIGEGLSFALVSFSCQARSTTGTTFAMFARRTDGLPCRNAIVFSSSFSGFGSTTLSWSR